MCIFGQTTWKYEANEQVNCSQMLGNLSKSGYNGDQSRHCHRDKEKSRMTTLLLANDLFGAGWFCNFRSLTSLSFWG